MSRRRRSNRQYDSADSDVLNSTDDETSTRKVAPGDREAKADSRVSIKKVLMRSLTASVLATFFLALLQTGTK